MCDVCPLDADNDIDRDGACGDVDNCPKIVKADLDQDGQGDLCDLQTCGNGIRETIEKCDDGNDMDNDGCSSHCITECIIAVSKAEVEWDNGRIKVKGDIGLPLGVMSFNVVPLGRFTIDIAGIDQVASEQFNFTVKGSEETGTCRRTKWSKRIQY